MTSSACQLAQDAYVCLTEDRLVFSDIRSDTYRCLDRSNTRAVLQILPDLQKQGDARMLECVAADREQAQSILRALVHAGLLADGEKNGKAFAPICIPTPTSSLLPGASASTPRLRLGYWVSFLRASLAASAKLRLQSLRRTIRGVESRKRPYRKPNSNDDGSLAECVAIFHRLRPYYVREYLCRFDSLALVEFLAHYRQFPTWVFGVKCEPFGAHCWIQDNDCVLNDSVEYVRQFTPIMVF